MVHRSVHVVYRTCAVENDHRRPSYYSKALCAQSMRRALEGTRVRSDLTVIQDGAATSAAVPVLSSIAAATIVTAGLGNGGSWQFALDVVARTDWPEDDLVYFVEDDYLHTEGAIDRLADAWELPPAARYFSLYEHPNAHPPGADAREYVYLGPGGYWRTITSTCMTFASRMGTLRADGAMLREAVSRTGKPLDYQLWIALQGGRGGRRWLSVYERIPQRPRLREASLNLAKAHMIRSRSPTRPQLVASLPSVATHVDLSEGLAHGVDWEQIARRMQPSDPLNRPAAWS